MDVERMLIDIAARVNGVSCGNMLGGKRWYCLANALWWDDWRDDHGTPDQVRLGIDYDCASTLEAAVTTIWLRVLGGEIRKR